MSHLGLQVCISLTLASCQAFVDLKLFELFALRPSSKMLGI